MTIRGRLTVWYSLVLAALMAAYAIASYALLARSSLRRIDRSLEETARAFAATLLAQSATQVAAAAPPRELLGRFAAGDLEIVILDRANAVVARTPPSVPGLMERAARQRLLSLLGQVAGAAGVIATIPGDDGPRRAFAMAIHAGDRRQLVVAAQRLREREAMLREARAASALAIAVALVLALAGGYFLAGRALAPVATLAGQARRIGAATINQRMRVRNEGDELGQLARAFNDLLARLERAFEQQRRFMADASHELRTPIAVVRGEADVALARETRPAADYREALDVVRDEARRMSRIVDDLLLLARWDAGDRATSPALLYLEEVVGESVRAVRALAAEHGVTLRYEPAGEMPMRGDEALLRRLVTNLLDNAIKYGGAGGEVVVRAERTAAGTYAVSVIDRGPGIPPEIRGRVFDRFVRGPQRRDEATPTVGAGLGLAIARQIAEAHGGSLELTRSEPDGTEFTVTLPANSPLAA